MAKKKPTTEANADDPGDKQPTIWGDGGLTPEQADSLPAEGSPAAAAPAPNPQDVQPRTPCMLTPGCSGRIVVWNSVRRPLPPAEGGESRGWQTLQNLHCNKCRRKIEGVRRLTQLRSGQPTVFDRNNPPRESEEF